MSARSARAFAARLKAEGGREFRARLSKAAGERLDELSSHHRLDSREVIERLIMGRPLGGMGEDGTEQQRLGMSDPEYLEFLAVRRSVQNEQHEI